VTAWRGTVLVAYCALDWPWRRTIEDHLYSFRRYGNADYVYVNLAVPWLANALLPLRFDALLWHTTFLAWVRWLPIGQRRGVMRRAARLAQRASFQAALPQDEFTGSDLVNRLFREYGVNHVFSVAPESEWPLIYDGLDRERVGFTRVLTGYLDEETVERIDRILAEGAERSVDIGYRAGPARPYLGRHALMKSEIAQVVRERAEARGLRVDISSRPEDTILGDDWYRFLASCRYTIGVEGGASVLDRDGSVRACAERYLKDHPDASFDEVETACFPERDGELALFAISPRHLEAAATRTAQILVDGAYNGALEPNRHYLGLRRDFSNVDEVLNAVEHDRALPGRLAQRAHQDVVASGAWTYRRLVQDVERELPERPRTRAGRVAAALAAAADAAGTPLLRLAKEVLMPARRRLYGLLDVRGYRRSAGLS
jgi:hypothetical protein